MIPDTTHMPSTKIHQRQCYHVQAHSSKNLYLALAGASTTQAALLPQLITQLRSNTLQLQQQLEASDPDGTGCIGVQALGQALLRCLPDVPPQQLRMLLVHVARTVLLGPADVGLPIQAVLQSLGMQVSGGQVDINWSANMHAVCRPSEWAEYYAGAPCRGA